MATQVIVVDDDPIVGTLTLELVQEAGFTARLVNDSLAAEEVIRAEKPELAILDILMPGIDGLTLLHRLKSHPETAGVRVIVVSGKSFETEKARALQYGAEKFLEKPYDVEGFGQTIAELLKSAGAKPQTVAPATPARGAGARVAVWGCRAPSAPDAPPSPRYGRNTPCVSIELSGRLLIFDAGSGLRALNDELASDGRFQEFWLFLTHFHEGHVEGLAEFARARDASTALNIAGAAEPDKPLDEAVAEALGPGAPACRISLYEMIERTYEILPGLRLTAFHANHPGTTLGFALRAEGRKIVYCPDSEVYGEAGTALQDYDEKLGSLASGADLLIHDGRYTAPDYKAHRNTGHSSFLTAIDLAGRCQAKRLLLVHQDGSYSDDALDGMARDAAAHAAEQGYALEVMIGREGLRLTV